MATIDMSDYTDTQDALDNVSRDTTNGDVFEYPDGWTETTTGNLDFSLYGSPTALAPLEMKGLGANTITLGGIWVYTNDYIILNNLNITSSTYGIIGTGNGSSYILCKDCTFEVTGSQVSVAYDRGHVKFVRCHIKGGSSRAFRNGPHWLYDCVLDDVYNFANGTYLQYYNCLFINDARAVGERIDCYRCTFVGSTWGIYSDNFSAHDCVFKDCGYGVIGIHATTRGFAGALRNNIFYNSTSADTLFNAPLIDEDNEYNAASDPVPNSGTGDYTTADVLDNYQDRGSLGDGSASYTGGNNGRGAILSYPTSGGGIQIARGMHGGIRG